jgi:hypothetical protein
MIFSENRYPLFGIMLEALSGPHELARDIVELIEVTKSDLQHASLSALVEGHLQSECIGQTSFKCERIGIL